MKAEVDKEVSVIKNELQQMIDGEIDKLTGQNKEAQELLKTLVSDVLNNLDNPQKMKEALQNTIENDLVGLLKTILNK